MNSSRVIRILLHIFLQINYHDTFLSHFENDQHDKILNKGASDFGGR